MLLLLACTSFSVNDEAVDASDDSSEPSSDLDCDASYDDSAPAGPDCLTGTLSCGDVVEGHTRGGSSVLDESFYETAFCFVPYTSYTGPERVYAIDLDAGLTATVILEAPCGDLGFGAARWSDEDTCPSGEDHAIIDCNGKPADTTSNTKEASFWAEIDTRFVVSVDGAEPAAFRLSVECE